MEKLISILEYFHTNYPIMAALTLAASGGAIIDITRHAIRSLREHTGDFSGKWKGSLYDETGSNIVKVDRYKIKQRGNVLLGKIVRISPLEQCHRKWSFIGRIVGNDFIAIFWSNDRGVFSYGCWLMQLKSDFMFSGYYLRPAFEKLPIVPIKIDLQKE